MGFRKYAARPVTTKPLKNIQVIYVRLKLPIKRFVFDPLCGMIIKVYATLDMPRTPLPVKSIPYA